ncbi:MAG: ribokinase [Anaerolineae bacterium]|nr:ribokinase [Anaerolineae bacterium]
MADVVVLGSLNMDLVVRTAHIPRPGETVPGEGFATIPGGKGANQAAAAARLGASVEMIGRVGQDSFGPLLVANMQAQGVGTVHIATDSAAPSGIALIAIAQDGENAIIVAPGANGRVSMDDVDNAAHLIAGARLLVMQFEIPLPVVRGALTLAQGSGVPVILNPAPAYPVEPGFLQGVHYLVANETEAELLTGVVVRDLPSATQAGQALVDMGIPVGIVTLGAQGALLVTPDEAVHVPARQVQVVDTTAAGDAFVGGLAVALLKGLDLDEAVRYATCAGTLATTVLGAQTSLPSAAQVQAFFEGRT